MVLKSAQSTAAKGFEKGSQKMMYNMLMSLMFIGIDDDLKCFEGVSMIISGRFMAFFQTI